MEDEGLGSGGFGRLQLHPSCQVPPFTVQGPLESDGNDNRGNFQAGFQILNVAVVNKCELCQLPLGQAALGSNAFQVLSEHGGHCGRDAQKVENISGWVVRERALSPGRAEAEFEG